MAKMLFALILIAGLIPFSYADEDTPNTVDLPEEELSLKQDREELDELRKNVPEEVKKDNDDLAFVLKLFDDQKRSASSIERQFKHVIEKLKKEKRREFKKLRDNFAKEEKSKRKEFLKGLKQKRQDFLAKKPETEAKQDFFKEERTVRSDFFSEERDRRRDFESELRSQQKDFDHFIGDKDKDFRDRLRDFKKLQQDLKNQEKAQERKDQSSSYGQTTDTRKLSPKNQQYLEDFKKIPQKTGETLAPPDGE